MEVKGEVAWELGEVSYGELVGRKSKASPMEGKSIFFSLLPSFEKGGSQRMIVPAPKDSGGEWLGVIGGGLSKIALPNPSYPKKETPHKHLIPTHFQHPRPFHNLYTCGAIASRWHHQDLLRASLENCRTSDATNATMEPSTPQWVVTMERSDSSPKFSWRLINSIYIGISLLVHSRLLSCYNFISDCESTVRDKLLAHHPANL